MTKPEPAASARFHTRPRSLDKAAPDAPLMRCVIYTRKSTTKGLEQRFNSLEAQEDTCKRWIEGHAVQGWKYVQTYTDAGISGGTADRPALKEMIAAAKARKFEYIVVVKVDRLARNQRDFLNMLDIFEKSGVEVSSVSEQFDTSTSLGRAMRNILGVFAEMERDMISERTREKMEASRRRGLFLSGRPPIGYVRDENKRLQIVPEKARVVRRVFDLYDATCSIKAVAKALNAESFCCRGVHGEDKKWNASAVQRTLRNPLYAGFVAGDEGLYEGQHEAIIPIELWNSVKEKLDKAGEEMKERLKRNEPKDKKRRSRMIYPLAGLLKCGYCGRRMVASYGGGGASGKFYRYYLCPTRKRYGEEECACPTLNASQVESFVISQLAALRDDPNFVATVISRMPEVPKNTVGDCCYNLEWLLHYGSPGDLVKIMKIAFASITFDWQNGKLDFRYRHINAEPEPQLKPVGLARPVPSSIQ